MAHELAHVQNRDILIGTIAATFAGAISMLGSMLQWGAMLGAGRSDDEEGSGGLVGSLVMAIIAPIAAMLIQMAVSRSREYLADESGARICGRPLALASALRKLHTASHMIPMQEARPASAHMFIVNPLPGAVLLAFLHPPARWRSASPGSQATGPAGGALIEAALRCRTGSSDQHPDRRRSTRDDRDHRNPRLVGGLLAFVLAMLALDLGVFHRKAHAVRLKEALVWSAVWIALALAFNAASTTGSGREAALEFLTGYLIEKALSVDNIFVFVVVFCLLRRARRSTSTGCSSGASSARSSCARSSSSPARR